MYIVGVQGGNGEYYVVLKVRRRICKAATSVPCTPAIATSYLSREIGGS